MEWRLFSWHCSVFPLCCFYLPAASSIQPQDFIFLLTFPDCACLCSFHPRIIFPCPHTMWMHVHFVCRCFIFVCTLSLCQMLLVCHCLLGLSIINVTFSPKCPFFLAHMLPCPESKHGRSVLLRRKNSLVNPFSHIVCTLHLNSVE